MDFTDEEKAYLFDAISKNYFERNFGTMLKADIDTLIFSVYGNTAQLTKARKCGKIRTDDFYYVAAVH